MFVAFCLCRHRFFIWKIPSPISCGIFWESPGSPHPIRYDVNPLCGGSREAVWCTEGDGGGVSPCSPVLKIFDDGAGCLVGKSASLGRRCVEVLRLVREDVMKRKWLLVLACAWFLWAQSAQPAEKSLIKISYVTMSFSIYKGSSSGDLDSISFSIQNLADRSLVWIKIRAVIRSNTGELIQTETFEEDLAKRPIAPGEARQVTHYVSIRGFMIDGKRGRVDINVVDRKIAD